MAGLKDDNQKHDLEEAMQQFVNAQLQGQKPDIDEFVKRYPELEDQIRKRIDKLNRINTLLDSIVQVDESDFEDTATGDDLVGQKIGNFEIVELIGRGGMGVVYLARDTKLDRSVAIKSMPVELQANSTARTRFTREAKLLASLSHPNIGVIHDVVEQTESRAFLVLEYIPGETLTERMARESLQLKDALSIGLQIAEAVCAAHETGVIHRDLKPSNIKITPEGRIKVLDFGLAKTAVGKSVAAEPTITQPGRVMGTPAYMSTQQARGKPSDRRTDIWSFGCVLYEMLTGRLPFEGETATDTLARIIEREPDWDQLPPTMPKNIRVLLRRCLAKDLNRRLQHMGDVVIELDETLNAPLEDPDLTEPLVGRSRRIVWRVGIACSLVGLVIGLIAAALFFRNSKTQDSAGTGTDQVRKFSITLPLDQVLFFQSSMFGSRLPAFSLSPDGQRLVYVARVGAKSQLFERRIDSYESRPIPGTEGASSPFFKPDGESVGFFDDEGCLKIISLLVGEPVTLSSKADQKGGSWGSDDMIYFSMGDSEIARVPTTGGDPEPLGTESEPVKGNYPQILPGCKDILISSAAGVSILSLESRKSKILIPGGYYARYEPTGHLVYARAGAIEVVPFSLTTRKVIGCPVPVLEGIQLNSKVGTAQFAFSEDGMLVYVPGGDIRKTIPSWVDRRGNVEPLGMSTRIYGNFKLSPDSKRLAITVEEHTSNIHIYDINRGTEIRLTKNGNNSNPLWTPDGRRVLFTRESEENNGQRHLLWAPADGSGEADVLISPGGSGWFPWSWSRDGKFLALHGYGDRPETNLDLSVLSMENLGEPKVILETESIEWAPSFSPDGQWIAYSSNRDGGNFRIYVQPYPEMDQLIPISKESGELPIWSRDGEELFYRNKNKWMVVSISKEPEFVAGTPEVLFEGPYGQVPGLSYDVVPDGQRFMVLLPEYDDSQVREFRVVTNWFEEMKGLVPTEKD